jgi:hypothetical protein
MSAPRSTHPPDFNLLTVGRHYEASTNTHTLRGEYLGVETPYGERRMLLRQANGKTTTIPFRFVVSLRVLRESITPVH